MMRTTTPLAVMLAVFLLPYYDLYVQLALRMVAVDASFRNWHPVATEPHNVGLEYLLPAVYLLLCYAMSEAAGVLWSSAIRTWNYGLTAGEGAVARFRPSSPES
jgi:hypothetical protein